MKIIDTYKSKSMNNLSKRPNGGKGIKYIVMHYVGAGSAKKGNAKANCQYFNSANRNASADFFIDNSGIYRYNPNCKKWYSWHCGDGHGKYGISNTNSIGIEVCINGDKPYTKREKRYAKQLVQYLMKKYSIDKKHVVRHYDASRKACPYYYTPSGKGKNKAWEKLRAYLTE